MALAPTIMILGANVYVTTQSTVSIGISSKHAIADNDKNQHIIVPHLLVSIFVFHIASYNWVCESFFIHELSALDFKINIRISYAMQDLICKIAITQ